MLFNPEYAWTIAFAESIPLANFESLKMTLYHGHTAEGVRDAFLTFWVALGKVRREFFSVTQQDSLRLKQLIDLARIEKEDEQSYNDGEFSIRSQVVQQFSGRGRASLRLTRRSRLLNFTLSKEWQHMQFVMDEEFVATFSRLLGVVSLIERQMSLPSTHLFDRALAYIFMKNKQYSWRSLVSDGTTIDDESLETFVGFGFDAHVIRLRRQMQKICNVYTIPLDTMRRLNKATLLTTVKSMLQQEIDTREGNVFYYLTTLTI